jgi:hypothetical protein
MSNISKRLVFFFVAFPALIILIVFLPHRHHWPSISYPPSPSAQPSRSSQHFRNRGVALSSWICFLLSFLGPSSSYLRISES